MSDIKIAVFIRTNSFTAQVKQLADELTLGFGSGVTVICDERLEDIPIKEFKKVSLTEELIASWGIAAAPQDWGWFCGDFCHYAAREAVPDADWYVVVESDVFMQGISARRIYEHLLQSEVDALACGLGRTDTPKPYSKDLKKLDITSRCGCIFPVTCVRKHIIEAMLVLRRRAQQHSNVLINDEAVLAGSLIAGGYLYEDLYKSLPELFSQTYFDTNPPHLFDAMPLPEVPNTIVHPAVSLDVILSRIESGEKKYSRHRLRHVLREAPRRSRLRIRAALAAKDDN